MTLDALLNVFAELLDQSLQPLYSLPHAGWHIVHIMRVGSLHEGSLGLSNLLQNGLCMLELFLKLLGRTTHVRGRGAMV